MSESNLSLSLDDLASELKRIGVQGTLKKYQRQVIPSKTLYDLAANHTGIPGARLFLATYPNTPSRLLGQIPVAETTEPDILQSLANHPRTPQEIRLELAAHPDPSVRKAVASCRAITPKAATLLAKDPVATVRCALAENPDLFQRIQLDLTDDEQSCVRVALALRKNPVPIVLEKLMGDSDVFVKAALAGLAPVPVRTLLALADSEDPVSQSCLLARRELTDDILESLSFSRHPDVSRKALSRKTLTPDEMLGWVDGDDPEKKRYVAGLATLPEPIQEHIAEIGNPPLWCALAANPGICENAAVLVARQNCPDALFVLAENPGCPSSVILRLCENGNPELRKRLSLRSDLGDEHLTVLFNRHSDSELAYHLVQNGHGQFTGLDKNTARTLSRSPHPCLRTLAAGCPELDSGEFPRLSRDPAPEVRKALIANPEISWGVLQILEHDSDPSVAETAHARQTLLQKQRTQLEKDRDGQRDLRDETAITPGLITKLIHKLKGL